MNLRTEINHRFLIRMGIVGLACLGMTAWCLNDGLVAWPAQQERATAYLKFQEENPDVGGQDLYDMWKEFAAEKGWEPGVAGSEKTPYGPPKSDIDINGQFYMGGFTAFLGLIFLGRVLLNRGCWIEADEDGLRSSENREVKFDQVTNLDKKKWANKGIAKLNYEVDGRKDRIVLDDCNYDRDTTNEILRHVEASIGRDKIINGKPEKPKKVDDETTDSAVASPTGEPAGASD